MLNDKQAAEPLAVSVKETERLLSISHTTFYELINNGQIDTFLVGKKRLVTYASIKRFVDQATHSKVAA